MKIKCLFLFSIGWILSGCDFNEYYVSQMPNEVQDGKEVLVLLAAKQFNEIESRLHPSINNPKTKSQLREVAEYFPSETPIEVKAIGSSTYVKDKIWQGVFTFQFEYSDSWLAASVTLQREGGSQPTIIGINVRSLEGDLEQIHKFELAGKSLTHYLILLGAIAIPAFIVLALILCIRTPMSKRKWLWILFILIGVVRVSLNWTTGAIDINPLGFQLLGAGFSKASPYAPVILMVAVPVGAIVFLIRRKSWLESAKVENKADRSLESNLE